MYVTSYNHVQRQKSHKIIIIVREANGFVRTAFSILFNYFVF